MNKDTPKLSREQLKRDWPLVALLLLLFGLSFYFYPRLPEQVPSHWNIRGEVDGYSSRFFGAFGIPLLSLALYVMFLVLPALDPKRANYHRFASTYNVIRWSVLGLMVLVHALVLLAGLGYNNDAGRVVQPAIALMLILMGNQMGRVKHNYFVGIRTPWTLASEEVWRKTHRMAGPLFVVGGLVALAATWLPAPHNFTIMMVSIIGTSLASLVYSYVVFKQLPPEG